MTIARDSFGVPHITAADWGSLSFGQGYAFAEDRACTLLDQIVKVRGERARWFGAGEDDANVNSDFAYRHLGIWEDAPQRWADQPALVQDAVTGYVAGFNTALEEVGVERVVRRRTVGRADHDPGSLRLYRRRSAVGVEPQLHQRDRLCPTAGRRATPRPETVPPSPTVGFGRSSTPSASNAWAFGAEASASGGGMLLANPHFPWEGELRLWENHLMIPGEVNVYGARLSGVLA